MIEPSRIFSDVDVSNIFCIAVVVVKMVQNLTRDRSAKPKQPTSTGAKQALDTG